MITSTTWSLTEMCRSLLKVQREDIDPDDTARYFDAAVSTPATLMEFVRHSEMDAWFNMAIASKVQILSLTRQLTNLAGNSWCVSLLHILYFSFSDLSHRNKTLTGGRAERNEYILLHEFHKLKYVCPDKYKRSIVEAAKAKEKAKQQKAKEEGGEEVVDKGKKDKYQGGLVFEPKRGLHDKIVLVMDFNSLYPSIIQEYNIDFTTVERDDSDEVLSFTGTSMG